MNVIKLVQVALKDQGFDGLFEAGICGCKIDDLSPGNCLTESCESGYLHTHSVTGEWAIHKHKEPIGDDRITEIIQNCS
jgi:hypothetical protein